MDSTKVEVFKIYNKINTPAPKSEPQHSPFGGALIGLIIGAILTLGTQRILEGWKSKKERQRRMLSLISKGEAKVYLISQILKEISMYKAHKQYYLLSMRIPGITTPSIERSHEKHYEKGQEQRQTETKLSEQIAEYFEIVNEFQLIEKQPGFFKSLFQKFINRFKSKDAFSLFENKKGEFDLLLNAIIDFKHPNPSDPETRFWMNKELEEWLENEKESLNDKYNSLRITFGMIQSTMNNNIWK